MKVAWSGPAAFSYIYISKNFELVEEELTAAPTVSPTASPTQPTFAPTMSPTYALGNPTPLPSFEPSPAPSPAPSFKPSPAPVAAVVEDASSISNADRTREKTISTFLGIGGVVVVCVIFLSYFLSGKSVDYFKKPSRVFAILACCLVVVVIALMLAWATENSPRAPAGATPSTSTTGFLGKPDMDTNVFAYHPLLLVAGFFCAQVYAVSSWSVITSHPVAKAVHIACQVIALVSLVVGIRAIVKYKYDGKRTQLGSSHSWLGVMCIIIFCVNFLWGSFMAALTRFVPASPIRALCDLRGVHRFLGVAALATTVIAIASGIQDKMGGVCNYVSPVPLTHADVNPANNFPQLPDACKISNGVAVAVVVAGLLVALAAHQRAREPADPKSHADEDDEDGSSGGASQPQPQPRDQKKPNFYRGVTKEGLRESLVSKGANVI